MNDIPLNEWIIEHFPTTYDSFVSSFENKLLCKLSKFHIFHASPNDVDYNVLLDHHLAVSLAPEVLQVLFAITSLKEEGRQPDAKLASLKKVKAKSLKQLKKRTHVPEFTKPLVDLNIAMPSTSPDAQAALIMFLGRLKDILEVCTLWHVFIISDRKIVLSEQDVIPSDRQFDQRWLHFP